MSRERWGTFSVTDHRLQRAFVADVLLYDRLVIPCQPQGAENTWPVAWKPELLESYLEILGSLAIPVPWDTAKREYFKSRYTTAQGVGMEAQTLAEYRRKNWDPLHLTRMLLAQEYLPELPKGVSKVWAIAAYPSLARFELDFSLDTQQNRRENLALILAHRFLTPARSGKEDTDLLREAVGLAKDAEFKRKRAALYAWQDNVIENGISDEKALEEMEGYLDEYNTLVKRATKKVYWRFAFLVAGVGIGLASAPLTPLGLAGAFIAVAQFAALDRTVDIQAGESAPAAMFHEAHKHFGWRDQD